MPLDRVKNQLSGTLGGMYQHLLAETLLTCKYVSEKTKKPPNFFFDFFAFGLHTMGDIPLHVYLHSASFGMLFIGRYLVVMEKTQKNLIDNSLSKNAFYEGKKLLKGSINAFFDSEMTFSKIFNHRKYFFIKL